MLKVKWQNGGQRVRYINLRRSGKRSNRALLGTIVTNVHANGRDHTGPTNTSDDAAKLLLKEIEESNSWGRVAFQVYFAWFGLQFGVNAAAAAWVLARTGPELQHFNLTCVLLITWNLLGALTTVLTYKALTARNERIMEVLSVLNRHYRTSDLQAESQSAMPRNMAVVFGFCAVTMFVSMFFWLFVLIGQ